jgi:antitoxin (DNA-binding transcriptional repressor) of toxin-antitoxin stability system
MSDAIEIGSFEAKTHFAELLRKVENGAVIHITRNGHSVAVLQKNNGTDNNRALDACCRIEARALKITGRNAGLVTFADIQEMKNAGRP